MRFAGPWQNHTWPCRRVSGFSQPIEIKDKADLRGCVLPDLIDDEDDVFLSGLSAYQIDHLLDARLLGLPHVERQRLEVLWPFELRIELCREPGRDLLATRGWL